MARRLVILANPLDRKEGWVKNHVNETLQKLGAAQDVEALEFSEELARCREKAAFKALLPKERERLAKELQGRDVLLFAPGSTASHLSGSAPAARSTACVSGSAPGNISVRYTRGPVTRTKDPLTAPK